MQKKKLIIFSGSSATWLSSRLGNDFLARCVESSQVKSKETAASRLQFSAAQPHNCLIFN